MVFSSHILSTHLQCLHIVAKWDNWVLCKDGELKHAGVFCYWWSLRWRLTTIGHICVCWQQWNEYSSWFGQLCALLYLSAKLGAAAPHWLAIPRSLSISPVKPVREQHITRCLCCLSTSVAVGLSRGCRLRAGRHKHLHIQTANLSVTGKALSEDAFLKCFSSLSQSTDKIK